MIGAYIQQMRPRQWTKNLILFAGIIFAEHLLDVDLLIRSVLGFITFCMISSSIYCLNDLSDIESDRQHPKKRHRPLPSGRVSVAGVWILGGVLLVGAVASAYLLAPGFAVVVGLYFVLNLGYSLRFKHVPIVDVILLAMGFVLRAVGSVEVLARPDVLISPWLLLCTFFLATFIGAGKRRAELALLDDAAADHRRALAGYSVTFLDRIMSSTVTSAIIAYAIYTLYPGTQEKFGTTDLVYTVPYVVYGLFRYLYLVYEKAEGGNPTDAILHDRPILLVVALWVATVVLILYGA